FQAEDGIRCFHVTGVQTCALPISAMATRTSFKATLCAALLALATAAAANTQEDPLFDKLDVDMDGFISRTEAVKEPRVAERFEKIGRASCRERGKTNAAGGSYE